MDPILLLSLFVVILILLAVLVSLFLVRRRRRRAAQAAPAGKGSRPKTAVAAPAEKPAPEKTEKKKEEARPAPVTATPAAPPAASPPPAPAAARPSEPAPRPMPPPRPAGPEFLGEKIRILVVDDNPETRGHVSRLLYFEKDMEVIGQAVNGRQGIEMAKELKPHIVLMDINMPDMDGITATHQMATDAPFSQVIIMSVQAEEHYMRQAMAAGARDFQPKPFTSDELNACIRRVYRIGRPAYQQLENAERTEAQLAAQAKAAPPQDQGALVIAVYSPKGGAGTSAIAANLAVALQQEHGDVLLMDGDLQFGDIQVHLNTKPTRTISDVIYESRFDLELLPDVILSHPSGLKLLLAPPQPELADAILPGMLAEITKALKQQFKIVVIDTDSRLSDKTITLFDAANYILVLSVPELPAVKNTKLFLEIAHQLEFGPDRLGMVLNRAGLPGGVPPEKIEKALNFQYSYQIPDDLRLHMSINRGVAVTQQDAGAPAAQAIIQMARDVLRRLSETRAAPVEEPA